MALNPFKYNTLANAKWHLLGFNQRHKAAFYLLHAVLYFIATSSYGQAHFTSSKPITYKQVNINHESGNGETLYTASINLTTITSLKDIKIEFREIRDTDSSTILIYKAGKLTQKLILPYPISHVDQVAYVADINNDKMPDVKFFIYTGGCGLAALLSAKIYLFKTGNKFKFVSFFDFSSEKEYDLNGDGVYEIISRNHAHKDGHNYWVYNAFNFKSNKLVPVSKPLGYPLWTKHLYRTDRVIAKDMPYKERIPCLTRGNDYQIKRMQLMMYQQKCADSMKQKKRPTLCRSINVGRSCVNLKRQLIYIVMQKPVVA